MLMTEPQQDTSLEKRENSKFTQKRAVFAAHKDRTEKHVKTHYAEYTLFTPELFARIGQELGGIKPDVVKLLLKDYLSTLPEHQAYEQELAAEQQRIYEQQQAARREQQAKEAAAEARRIKLAQAKAAKLEAEAKKQEIKPTPKPLPEKPITSETVANKTTVEMPAMPNKVASEEITPQPLEMASTSTDTPMTEQPQKLPKTKATKSVKASVSKQSELQVELDSHAPMIQETETAKTVDTPKTEKLNRLTTFQSLVRRHRHLTAIPLFHLDNIQIAFLMGISSETARKIRADHTKGIRPQPLTQEEQYILFESPDYNAVREQVLNAEIRAKAVYQHLNELNIQSTQQFTPEIVDAICAEFKIPTQHTLWRLIYFWLRYNKHQNKQKFEGNLPSNLVSGESPLVRYQKMITNYENQLAQGNLPVTILRPCKMEANSIDEAYQLIEKADKRFRSLISNDFKHQRDIIRLVFKDDNSKYNILLATVHFLPTAYRHAHLERLRSRSNNWQQLLREVTDKPLNYIVIDEPQANLEMVQNFYFDESNFIGLGKIVSLSEMTSAQRKLKYNAHQAIKTVKRSNTAPNPNLAPFDLTLKAELDWLDEKDRPQKNINEEILNRLIQQQDKLNTFKSGLENLEWSALTTLLEDTITLLKEQEKYFS